MTTKDDVKTDTKAEVKEEKVVQEKETKKEKVTGGKLSVKLDKIAKEIEGLTVLEISELTSYLEEVFGVSALPMAAAPVASSAATASDAGPSEEKTKFTVMLTDAGANKLNVIKAVREVRQDLGLMDAKKIVEEAPKEILKEVKKEEAEEAVKKLSDAGAKAEMK